MIHTNEPFYLSLTQQAEALDERRREGLVRNLTSESWTRLESGEWVRTRTIGAHRMESFLTGSRVYGTPTEQSDIDLCVSLSGIDTQMLCELSDQPGASGNHSLRFGKLNIIILPAGEFEAWKEATDELASRKPVTREEAVALIKAKVKARKSAERREAA